MKEPLMRGIVDTLASVKSQQDIQGALNIYHPLAKLVTVGLNAEAKGTLEIEQQLNVFYKLFPDYHVEFTHIACNEKVLLATGNIYATPTLPNQQCIAVKQPACFSFEFKDNKIYREVFYFDFSQLCNKAGISQQQLSNAAKYYLAGQ